MAFEIKRADRGNNGLYPAARAASKLETAREFFCFSASQHNVARTLATQARKLIMAARKPKLKRRRLC